MESIISISSQLLQLAVALYKTYVANSEEYGCVNEIIELFPSSCFQAWIGMHKVSGQWQWSDGTSAGFTDWGSWGSVQQPDNAGGHQDCVKIGWSKSKTQWDDQTCSKNYHYICKKSTM